MLGLDWLLAQLLRAINTLEPAKNFGQAIGIQIDTGHKHTEPDFYLAELLPFVLLKTAKIFKSK